MRYLKIVGFAPPGPRWFPPAPTPPLALAEPPAATVDNLADTETIVEPTPVPRRHPRPPPKADPAPANIKPYWARAELPKIDVQAPRTGPKVKTRKAPVASKPSVASVPEVNPSLTKGNVMQELPAFWVGKRVLNTFTRLFSGGKEKGDLSFEDFQYVRFFYTAFVCPLTLTCLQRQAMTSIGFSLIPKGGSIVTFIAPGEFETIIFHTFQTDGTLSW